MFYQNHSLVAIFCNLIILIFGLILWLGKYSGYLTGFGMILCYILDLDLKILGQLTGLRLILS